jgi:hypothetical protein
VLYASASYRLPGHRAPEWLRSIASDWQVDLTGMYRSGRPVTVTTQSGLYALRPDLIENVPLWIPDSTSPTGQIVNRAAFTPVEQVEQRQGTLGRNTLRSSPLRQIDLSISRFVRVGERRVTLRLDAFNVLNTTNVGPPRSFLTTNPTFGHPLQTYANALGTGTLTGGGLMPVQQVGGPRSIQLGLRFDF